MTPVWCEEIDVSDSTQVVVQHSHGGEMIPFMSLFDYVRHFSNRLGARHFVMGMRIRGINVYFYGGRTMHLAAAGGCASGWLHCSSRNAARCRCRSDRIDSQSLVWSTESSTSTA